MPLIMVVVETFEETRFLCLQRKVKLSPIVLGNQNTPHLQEFISLISVSSSFAHVGSMLYKTLQW